MWRKLLAALLLLIIGLVLQIASGEFFGIFVNFIFAALVAAAFFANIFEMVLLALFAVFVFNWQPVLSLEAIAICGLPLVFHYLRNFLPWQAWLINLFFVFSGIVLLYAVFGFSLVIAEPSIFLFDLSGSLVFGLAAFWILEKAPNRL